MLDDLRPGEWTALAEEIRRRQEAGEVPLTLAAMAALMQRG